MLWITYKETYMRESSGKPIKHTPWDSLDVPFDPLGPLSPGQLKTRNVAWELQISAQFTPGLVNIGFSNKVPVRVKEKKV